MGLRLVVFQLVLLAVALPLAAAEASPAVCAPCHRAETQTFSRAGMARTLASAANSRVLRTHPKLTGQIGQYSYEIVRAGDESVLTVSDGRRNLRAPLDWAFGAGVSAQTFAYRLDGQWYESRVSYYSVLAGLDLTIGAPNAAPPSLLEAAGHLSKPLDMGKCFGCHATNVVKSPALDLSGMIGGVQCERCHGPSEAHLRAVRTGGPAASMRKLGGMTTEETSDFCGQCHRTWAEIAAEGPHGIQNVRFQPYRLANSKCYDAEDPRIRCTACHNPHRELETSADAYDAKCAVCHSAAARRTKASAHLCRVGTRDCAACHMPQLELPGAHRKFTDHRIRIARADEPYPD